MTHLADEVVLRYSIIGVWGFSFLTLKNLFFIENSSGNKYSRLANQSQIILYSSTTFWLVSKSNTLIYVHEKSNPSTY